MKLQKEILVENDEDKIIQNEKKVEKINYIILREKNRELCGSSADSSAATASASSPINCIEKQIERRALKRFSEFALHFSKL